VEIIKKELPVDILGFTLLTPLPGSEDHKVLWEKGVWMDPDMNQYDAEHMVTHDSRMTRAEWEELNRSLWKAYYTPEHIETVLRRAAANNCSMSRLQGLLYIYSTTLENEGIHPYHGGVVRRKYRLDRRPGMPVEPIWSFYPKFAYDFVWKYSRIVKQLIWITRLCHKIRKDPNRFAYTDQALTPVSEGETEKLELFTQNDTARQAVEHAHKVAQLTRTDTRVTPERAALPM
jgi:hypothetical protein